MPIDGVNLEFHPLRYRLALTACLVPFGLMTPLLEIGPTHVFNPDWPAHARLHEVWQLVTHGGLAALCLWLAWARGQVRLATGIVVITVRITADTSIKGVPVFTGDIVETDEADARILISYRLAEPYEPQETEATEEIPEETNTRKKRRT